MKLYRGHRFGKELIIDYFFRFSDSGTLVFLITKMKLISLIVDHRSEAGVSVYEIENLLHRGVRQTASVPGFIQNFWSEFDIVSVSWKRKGSLGCARSQRAGVSVTFIAAGAPL